MNFQAYKLLRHPEWTCITLATPDLDSRVPIHLCCVIDTSGSMDEESKLENVKRSLQYLLDFLGPKDLLSVVTFSDVAKTVMRQLSVSNSEKEHTRARISIINADSNTNLSGGIIEANNCLLANTHTYKQGILLLTDGIANVGLTSKHHIIDLVQVTVDKFVGTSVSCIGYGTDHNVELLQTMSTIGGGNYYVVNNLEDVAVVFGDVLGGLVSCYAQQVRIILPPGTVINTRYMEETMIGDGDANATNEGSKVVTIGDMPSGMEAVVLAKLPTNATDHLHIIHMKGYDLHSHTMFEMTTKPLTTVDEVLQTNGEAHYIRFEVLKLIETSHTILKHSAKTTTGLQQCAKIDECVQMIMSYRMEHEHALWDVLIEELHTCKNALKNRNRYDTEVLSQHGTCLSRMRGIAANMSDHYGTSSRQGAMRTFSNTVQQNMSSQLTDSMGIRDSTDSHRIIPPPPLRRQSATTEPVNYTGSPMVSPILHYSHNSVESQSFDSHSTEIHSNDFHSRDVLPMPTHQLIRQRAIGIQTPISPLPLSEMPVSGAINDYSYFE